MNKILIIGPIFNSPSGPMGVGGALFVVFKNKGLKVIKASKFRNRILRMIDIIYTILANLFSTKIILLQSFGLRAFIMEDIVSRIALISKIPIVFTLHGGAFYEFYEQHPNWVRKVLTRATMITSPSYFLCEKFKKEGIIVSHIPNAIDLSRFEVERDISSPHSVLWVRAFHDIYDPELAIYCINELRLQYPNIHLTMAGPDQGSLSQCKALIASLGLEKHISILGYISNHDLPFLYATHAVYINTTRYESFGVALVEAAANGIPIVSTNVGEIPYIWQDKKNLLLSERSPRSFAAQIATLFENHSFADSMSAAAQENVQQYDWAQVLPKWEELIEKYSKK